MAASTPFGIFIEKKKRRNSSTATDDLATVKAAAWAWYQHGSGSEGKQMTEFHVTTTHHRHHHNETFRPSRYKLEAMNKMKESSNQQESSSSSTTSQLPSLVHTEDNSLLDAYEVERISKQLDYLLMASSNRLHSQAFNKNLDRQRSSNSTISSASDAAYSSSSSSTSAMKKTINRKFIKGLWTRPLVVCGTRDDVDSRAFRNSPPPLRLPVLGKHVTVVSRHV